MLRRFLFPANLVVFSTYYLIYNIKHDKSLELKQELEKLEPDTAEVMFEHLVADGIWSLERIVATPRAYYPAELTRTKKSRELIFAVKDHVRNR